MVDRFGPLPDEVTALLDVMEIKALCRTAGIEKIDAGPKGATIAFRKSAFANPEGLVRYITVHRAMVKLQSDQRLLVRGEWTDASVRLKAVRDFVTKLADIARSPKKAA